MARAKKKDDSGGLLVLGVGLIIFIPFFLFSFMRFLLLQDQYLKSESAVRVVDIWGVKPMLIKCGIFTIISAVILNIAFDKSIVAALLLTVVLVTACILLGMRLSIIYLGPVIDDKKNIVAFPPDFQSFTITDFFSLKPLNAFYNTDEVKLSDILKMTRQAGKYLYIHGDFGSRKLAFSTKQKRDECIATIQATENYNGQMIMELENSD